MPHKHSDPVSSLGLTYPPHETPAISPPRAVSSRAWVLALLIGIAGFFAVHPFDGPMSAAAARLSKSLGGDVRRELFAWQQYGQATAIIVTALLVWLLDPANRKRLLDLLLAVVIAWIAAEGGKLLIGRPRPRDMFEDPRTFLGPFGEYPIKVKGAWKLVHAWDIRGGAGSDLWSMPSSHTMFAAVLSVFLATVYPKIRWVAYALLVLVATGRVLFDAHWPTDVIVGGAAGWAIGAWTIGGKHGMRLAKLTKAESAARAG